MEHRIASESRHFPALQAHQHHMHSIRNSSPKDLSEWSIQLCPYQEVATDYLDHLRNSAKYMIKQQQKKKI